MRRLLVAYDSSDQANAALDVAIAVARSEGAAIVACFALKMSAEIGRIAAAFHYAPASAARMLRDDARAVLESATMRAAAAGLKIRTKLLDAPVVAGITAYARRIGAEMIVVGSHGRSGLPRFLLGSVAEGLMRHASVPVLVVRAPTEGRSRGRRARTPKARGPSRPSSVRR
jgi:nucleotide-binding universal stress UspA family protein